MKSGTNRHQLLLVNLIILNSKQATFLSSDYLVILEEAMVFHMEIAFK